MQYILGGDSLVLNESRCNGCGRCEEVCPHAVFAVVHRKATVVHRGNCMQCGACRMNCPVAAIEVSSGVGCVAGILNSIRRGDPTGASCDCA
jgi:NAD-dependent dihydropyrimidine dehydrogenase PreA subunit